MQQSNAANRLDRLPISRFHKITLVAISFAYFFEFADINTFAVTVPKLIKLWGVTINQIAYVTSLSFVGMFFGSLVGRLASPTGGAGRRRSSGPPCGSRSSRSPQCSPGTSFSLGVMRVLTSAGLSAMTVVAVIYVNEMFPAAVRGKYQAYAIVIGICGTPVTNLIASLVVPLSDWSWRLVYLWGRLGVLLLVFARYLKESPRWYESKGEYDKADAVLSEIEARVAAEKGPLPEPGPPVVVAKAGQGAAEPAAAEEVPRSDDPAQRPVGDPDHRLLRLLQLGADPAGPRRPQRGEVDLLRRAVTRSGHRWAASSLHWLPTASNASGAWSPSARRSRSAVCSTGSPSTRS